MNSIKSTQKHKPNISDVAKAAGVSIATVSYVINGTRYVSNEVAQRVRKAIEELGYIPSSVARGLAKKRTKIIGVIFSDISNPFFTSIYIGIESVLSEEGYELILINTGEVDEKQELALKTLLSRQIDGLIIAPTGHKSKMLNYILDSGTPIVLIDRMPAIKGASLVDIDNVAAAYQATTHLIQDGYQRIGVIIGLPEVSTSQSRLKGYQKAITHFGIPYREEYVICGKSRIEGGYEAVKNLMSLPHPPEAIFTTNNLMTVGALRACRDLGLKCPADLGIAGFDDIELGDLIMPPLTTIRQPTLEIGVRAAKILLEETKEPKIIHEQLQAELTVRGSCSTRCLERYSSKSNLLMASTTVEKYKLNN